MATSKKDCILCKKEKAVDHFYSLERTFLIADQKVRITVYPDKLVCHKCVSELLRTWVEK